jgi:DNA-binding MarR family transcriptional regulator
MEPTIIVQKLKINQEDDFLLAEKYYYILSVLNDLKLTEREAQLIAFTAIKGNISYKHLREEFCIKYNTSSPTINNIISKLKKMNILVKDKSKVKVNPVIILKFSSDIKLEITLAHG